MTILLLYYRVLSLYSYSTSMLISDFQLIKEPRLTVKPYYRIVTYPDHSVTIFTPPNPPFHRPEQAPRDQL